jgi:MoaA/NifB/PqqE/SkfB family radical SAM enzyme
MPATIIQVTHKCPYRCEKCLVRGRIPEGELSEAALKRALEQVGPFEAINFSGGEPFVHPRLERLVALALETRPKASLSVTTNGFFASSVDAARKRLSFDPAVKLLVSVDEHHAAQNPRLREHLENLIAVCREQGRAFEVNAHLDRRKGETLAALVAKFGLQGVKVNAGPLKGSPDSHGYVIVTPQGKFVDGGLANERAD